MSGVYHMEGKDYGNCWFLWERGLVTNIITFSKQSLSQLYQCSMFLSTCSNVSFCPPSILYRYSASQTGQDIPRNTATLSPRPLGCCPMQSFSLYLDHQGVAPLIHHLEDVVQLAVQHHQGKYLPHELRLPIYQEFVAILHQLYLQQTKTNPIAPQLAPPPPSTPYPLPSAPRPQALRSMRSLQMQVNLAEWLISGGQRVVDKREIDLKYQELSRSKRVLNIEQLKNLMGKYGLKGIVIRAKGEEHKLEDTQDSSIKREEISREDEPETESSFKQKTVVPIQEAIQEESSQEEEEQVKKESFFESHNLAEPCSQGSISAEQLII